MREELRLNDTLSKRFYNTFITATRFYTHRQLVEHARRAFGYRSSLFIRREEGEGGTPMLRSFSLSAPGRGARLGLPLVCRCAVSNTADRRYPLPEPPWCPLR